MMKYALIHGERICQVVATEEDCFPVAPELTWQSVADDTTTDDAFVDGAIVKYVAPPVAVPPITKRQALLWLLSQGKTEADVLNAIAAISDPIQRSAAQIAWDYPDGGILHRSHPLFDQLGPALGFSMSSQMDDAFRAAARL